MRSNWLDDEHREVLKSLTSWNMFSNVKRIGLYVSCPNLKVSRSKDLPLAHATLPTDGATPTLTLKYRKWRRRTCSAFAWI